uniref:Uncharacterized protein n=1 Tax=Oncorhynchus kisutch TaxID=8019 RepID=A0A8C7GSR6_ONCKI
MMIVCVSPDIMQSQQGFAKVGSFRGIYAGVSSAAIGSFPNDESLIMSLCMLGVIVPCLIRVPTEEVKQRTQALLEEGVRGLYRGYGSAVHREVGLFYHTHTFPSTLTSTQLSKPPSNIIGKIMDSS